MSSTSLFVIGWRYAMIASASSEARPSLFGRSRCKSARTCRPQLGDVCIRYAPPAQTRRKPTPETSSAFSRPRSAESISFDVHVRYTSIISASSPSPASTARTTSRISAAVSGVSLAKSSAPTISCSEPGSGILASSLIVVRPLQRHVVGLLLRREYRDLVERRVLVHDDAVLA